MSRSHGELRTEDLEFLDTLGAAISGDHTSVPFECYPLPGWPFIWLLHPGLPDGMRVADLESCSRLEETGFIAFIQDQESAYCHAVLTEEGHACYRRRRDDADHTDAALA
jgi:hypothetical protein